jgi:hypothetical protein
MFQVKYQEVFSKVGVFSPSFWFNDLIYDFAETEGKQEAMKFFFLAGGQESESLDTQVTSMTQVLSDAGFTDAEWRYDFVPSGQHSEWFWAQEFPDAFKWLFMEDALRTQNVALPKIGLFPNPSMEFFTLDFSGAGIAAIVTLVDQFGRSVEQFEKGNRRFEIGHLPAGLYFVKVETAEQTAVLKLIKH